MSGGGWGGSQVPQGWYQDPWGAAPMRWWDGTAWTGWTAPAGPAIPAAGDGGARSTGGPLALWARLAVVAYPVIQLTVTIAVCAGMGGIRTAFHTFESEVGVPGEVATLNLPSWTHLLSVVQVVTVGVCVPFLVWQFRAASEARRRGYPASRSPGMGIAAWFIPVVNLWMPYQSLRDCLPPEHPARRQALTAWLGYLFGGGLDFLAIVVAYNAGPAAAFVVAAAVAWGLLAVLGWRLVGLVAADQAGGAESSSSGQGGWQVSQA